MHGIIQFFGGLSLLILPVGVKVLRRQLFMQVAALGLVQRLNRLGVILARFGEIGFFGGEFLDDLFRRKVLGFVCRGGQAAQAQSRHK